MLTPPVKEPKKNFKLARRPSVSPFQSRVQPQQGAAITRSFRDNLKLSQGEKEIFWWSFVFDKSGHIIVPVFHPSRTQLRMQRGGLKCIRAQKNLAFTKYPDEAGVWPRVSNRKHKR